MSDMSVVIEPKSDQINADDLIGGPRTITISEVRISPGTEQPVQIHFSGDNGKPWRPCKSMSRVLVQAWGPDAKQYVGRSVTLYRDPTVKWGGMDVGGIRISHMSHIENDMVMALTATRGQRKPFKVQKLAAKPDKVADGVRDLLARIVTDDIATIEADPAVVKQREWLAKNRPELAAEIDAAIRDRAAADDPFGLPPLETEDHREGRDDADMGEGFVDEGEAEESPTEAKLKSIRASIAAAKNAAGLKHVDAEWVNARGAYDDDTAAEIDGLISAKRGELAS